MATAALTLSSQTDTLFKPAGVALSVSIPIILIRTDALSIAQSTTPLSHALRSAAHLRDQHVTAKVSRDLIRLRSTSLFATAAAYNDLEIGNQASME